MESWRHCWREGIALLLTDAMLNALEKGLAEDDPTLIQGATCTPPPLDCLADWPVEAACLLGYCAWKGAGKLTVAGVNEFFAITCFEVDKLLEEPAGCRWFLNWFDETPRPELFRLLLPEVREEQARREPRILPMKG